MEDRVEQVLAARRRRPRSGLALGFGVAIGIHLAALGLFLSAQGKAESRPPIEYVAVRAVPLQALGKPKATPPKPTASKPEPKPVESVPTPPKQAPPLPSARPKPEDRAKPVKPDGSKASPSEPTPALPTQAEPDDAAPPGMAGTDQGSSQGSSAFGAHRLEGIDPDFTYDYYLDQMLALIHAQWQKPTTQGDVYSVVRFTVQKNGEITAQELAESSGSNAFDLAALRAIRNANPLPRLPASYRRTALEVTLIVRSE